MSEGVKHKLTYHADRWLPDSDLPIGWRRTGRWAVHFPGDVAFERSEPASIFRDVVAAAIIPVFATLTPAHLLLAKWISSRVPAAINLVRSIGHRNPYAKPFTSLRHPGEFWRRDWTYFSRPRAHQLWYIAQKVEKPLELEDGANIPRWVRHLTESADRKSKFHPVSMFEDWICSRSRVVGFVADTAFVSLGLVLHFVPLGTLMLIQTVVTVIPGLLGGYIGFKNHCLLRGLRGGAFQRDGVVEPKKETSVEFGVDNTLEPQNTRAIRAASKHVVLAGRERRVAPMRAPKRVDLSRRLQVAGMDARRHHRSAVLQPKLTGGRRGAMELR